MQKSRASHWWSILLYKDELDMVSSSPFSFVRLWSDCCLISKKVEALILLNMCVYLVTVSNCNWTVLQIYNLWCLHVPVYFPVGLKRTLHLFSGGLWVIWWDLVTLRHWQIGWAPTWRKLVITRHGYLIFKVLRRCSILTGKWNILTYLEINIWKTV